MVAPNHSQQLCATTAAHIKELIEDKVNGDIAVKPGTKRHSKFANLLAKVVE